MLALPHALGVTIKSLPNSGFGSSSDCSTINNFKPLKRILSLDLLKKEETSFLENLNRSLKLTIEIKMALRKGPNFFD